MPLPRIGCFCAAFLTATIALAQSPGPTETSNASGEVRVDDLALGKPVTPTTSTVPAPTDTSSAAPQVLAPEFAQAPSASTPAAATTASQLPEPAPKDSRPKRLPYNGEAAMPGYERVEQRRWWMVAAGGAMFSVGYVAGIAIAEDAGFDDGLGFTAIPVVGPWIALSAHDDSCSPEAFDCRTLDEESLVATGIIQDVGALLLAIGLASSREVWVRDDAAWTVTPLVGRARSGFQVTGSF